jgi:hypothetical protein
MKHRTGLLAIPAFVVAAVAFAAAPAPAATTFTVSPGGAWSGTQAAGSTVGIRDAVSNQVTLCSGLAVAGSFKSGKGNATPGLPRPGREAVRPDRPRRLRQPDRRLGDHLPGADDQLTLTDAHPAGPPSPMRGWARALDKPIKRSRPGSGL